MKKPNNSFNTLPKKSPWLPNQDYYLHVLPYI